jgi:hypothetical protein
MAYIVSVRARYCQILRFKARSNERPGFGRRSSILDERLCPFGASLVPCRVRCVELTPEAVSGAAWSYPFISERTAIRLRGRVARRSVYQGSGAIVVGALIRLRIWPTRLSIFSRSRPSHSTARPFRIKSSNACRADARSLAEDFRSIGVASNSASSRARLSIERYCASIRPSCSRLGFVYRQPRG